MSDVTWHPVDETPPEDGALCWTWCQYGLGLAHAAVSDDGVEWYPSSDPTGEPVTGVAITHYAEIVYPEPPEDA